MGVLSGTLRPMAFKNVKKPLFSAVFRRFLWDGCDFKFEIPQSPLRGLFYCRRIIGFLDYWIVNFVGPAHPSIHPIIQQSVFSSGNAFHPMASGLFLKAKSCPGM